MKEGALSRTSRWLRTLIAALCLLAPLHSALPAHAAPGFLELGRDFVDSIEPGAPGIGHSMYFVLPANAQQVIPSDWILIEMPHYFEITVGSNFTLAGSYGTPTVSVDGTTVKITDIALLPGAGINIDGIRARNPNQLIKELVTFKVTDPDGTTVRNQTTVEASASRNIIGVSATVDTPTSSLNINGYTAPNSFVTLVENPSVIGTTTSGGNGFFAFTLTGLPPGEHSYRINSSDSQNRSTSQYVLNLFLLGGNLTTVSNLLLSSTISLSDTEIDPGETITVSGSAKPNSQINIFVEAPLRNYTTTSNGSGDWNFLISSGETQGYNPGQYQVYTVTQDSGGTQSQASQARNFTVKSPNVGDPDNPPPNCNISKGDLNCDTRTNLTDFSILLFHWQTNHKVADINGDTKVNLTDFSIMMFYFTR